MCGSCAGLAAPGTEPAGEDEKAYHWLSAVSPGIGSLPLQLASSVPLSQPALSSTVGLKGQSRTLLTEIASASAQLGRAVVRRPSSGPLPSTSPNGQSWVQVSL